VKLSAKQDGNVRDEDFTGFVCRACGCRQFRVIYLKRLPGELRRRRECSHCGKRVTTKERVSG